MSGSALDFNNELLDIAIGVVAILVGALILLGVVIFRPRKDAPSKENIIERVGPPKPHFRTERRRVRPRRNIAGSAAEPGDE
jgi:hypothetical protein